MARQEQDKVLYTPSTNPSPPGQPQDSHVLQDYQMSLMLLEQGYVNPGTNSMLYCKALARHPVEVSCSSLAHFMRSAQSFHFVELR
jgi:hypothetical protein